MAHKNDKSHSILPLTILTVADLGRMRRELDSLEEYSMQSEVRNPGHQPQLPRTSRGLEEFAGQYDVNLLIDNQRAKLKQLLDKLLDSAPVIHISFSSDPSPAFLTKLVTWLRNEIHPLILVSVGLQPGIAAGCVVRTTNKYFDMSLRKNLLEKSKMLADSIREPVST